MNLGKYVFLSDYTNPPTCDVGILFGGYEMIPNRADDAINLYKKKQIKKILVTGGIGYTSKNKQDNESNLLFDYLTNNGVLESDILIENKSKNTYQNIRYSLKILSKYYNLDDTKILLITSDFHLKRCLYITRVFLKKNSNIYGCPVKSIKANKNDYKKSFEGRKMIFNEAFLLLISHLKK